MLESLFNKVAGLKAFLQNTFVGCFLLTTILQKKKNNNLIFVNILTNPNFQREESADMF